MKRCADASFLIDVVRSDIGAVRLVREMQLGGESLHAPAPAVAELLLGALLHKGRARSETIALAEEIETIPTDYLVAAEAAQIASELSGRGRPLPMIDALIAATARLQKMALVTRDKAFSNISGLTIQGY